MICYSRKSAKDAEEVDDFIKTLKDAGEAFGIVVKEPFYLEFDGFDIEKWVY